jgi:4'-phosphopantetheinyl transferase
MNSNARCGVQEFDVHRPSLVSATANKPTLPSQSAGRPYDPAANSGHRLALEAGRVDLWCAFLDDVTEPDLSAYRELASADERARCDRFLVAEAQRRYLISRALLRTTLSQYSGHAPESWAFAANSHGKPSILEPAGTGLQFNVSHTAGLAVCAVTSGAEIGVDAEYVDRDFATVSVARLSFTAEEAAALDAAPPDERMRRFFQLWTLKEAFVKGIGRGLNLPMKEFAIRMEPWQPPRVSSATERSNWNFAQIRMGSKHQISVCVEAAEQSEMSICVRQAVPLRGIVRCEVLPYRLSNEWALAWR